MLKAGRYGHIMALPVVPVTAEAEEAKAPEGLVSAGLLTV
jgi:hypothetical protein